MTTKFKKSSDLEGKTLSEDNILIFSGMNYSVNDSFLANAHGSNHEIFEILGIENKETFCSKYYGYLASPGDFPEAKEEDYAALTRVAVPLMRLAEMKTVKDALEECSRVKEDPRTISLLPKAESLEKALHGRKSDEQLNDAESKQVRELFNSAEDIFYPDPAKISEKSESLAGKTLQLGNTVTFFGVIHTVARNTTCGRNTLYLEANKQNDGYVFKKLGMSDLEKERFSEKHYGYSTDGAFPEARGNDFKALTKLVVALLKKIENMKETVTT